MRQRQTVDFKKQSQMARVHGTGTENRELEHLSSCSQLDAWQCSHLTRTTCPQENQRETRELHSIGAYRECGKRKGDRRVAYQVTRVDVQVRVLAVGSNVDGATLCLRGMVERLRSVAHAPNTS